MPDVNIPVALYVIAQDPVGDGSRWLIARSALKSDGDGQGFVAHSRYGHEEILWFEWVELEELELSPPRRGNNIAIDCLNQGDGLDLPTLPAVCPAELLRAGDGAWSPGVGAVDFDIGSPDAPESPTSSRRCGRHSSARRQRKAHHW